MSGTQQHHPCDLTDWELRVELATATGERATALKAEQDARAQWRREFPPLRIGFRGAGKGPGAR
jgi:hypothetical protein